MDKTKIQWIMVILLLVGGGLRMFQLEQTPPGFYLDEASGSYDAFSLWHTGHDQHGNFLPMTLRAFNDYRPPLYSYMMSPLVGFAGLSVMTARLSSVYWGFLSLAALYWVGSMLFNRAVGLTAAFLLTIAPWHVHFSRLAIEVNLAAFFVLLALGLFFRWQRKPESHCLWVVAVISGLGLYTYSSVKMTMPLTIGVLAVVFWKKLRSHSRDVLTSLSIGCLLSAPMVYMTMVNSGTMQDHFRQISIFQPRRPVLALAEDVVMNFWANISPRYLFYEGSLDIVMHPPGMGQLFGAQAVLLLFGVVCIIKQREWHLSGFLTSLWIVASIIPATLTRHVLGTGHAQRTYPVVIAWQLLSAVGFIGLYQWLKPRFLKKVMILAISIWILSQGLIHYRYYFTNYAVDSASQFYAGVGELVKAVDNVEDTYHAVYYTTYGNDLPYIHFLFYSKYDPERLLDDGLVTDPSIPDRVIQMGKYTFTQQVKELYLSGLPGLYVLPAFDIPDVEGLDVISKFKGIPQYKILGRERIMLNTADWLGQCTLPVAPLTYAIVAPTDDRLWLANFDCTATWVYPQSGTTARGYIFHRDMEAQMNDFTLRHIAGAQPVLSLSHQILGVGAFSAYEQHNVPGKPESVSGVLFPAEAMPDSGSAGLIESTTFDGKITFIGTRSYSNAEQIEIETWWYVAEGEISRPVSIMAHLLDESGSMISNADGLGLSPVVLREGDYFVQRHVFQGTTFAQPVWLRLGVYWLDTMERWPITGHMGADALFVKLNDNG